MKFGMTDKQFSLLNVVVIDPLKSLGAEVYIFGSRVSDHHHPHSDVDILFRVKEPIPSGQLAAIKEAIEESSFPFIVDVVDEQDLVESYRKNVLASMQEV